MVTQLSLTKEDLEWLARKSKSIGYYRRHYPVTQRKNNVSYKSENTTYENSKNADSVVVKITDGAKNFEHAKYHTSYISRNGKLEIYDDDNLIISPDDMNAELNIDCALQDQISERAKNSKKTYQMMFSLKGKNDPEVFIWLSLANLSMDKNA